MDVLYSVSAIIISFIYLYQLLYLIKPQIRFVCPCNTINKDVL